MSLRSETKAAENVLAARGKRIAAIASEVSKLTEFLALLLAAETCLQEAEASEAVGEASTGTVAKARARVEAIRRDIEAVSSRLAGLRRSAASYGPEMAQRHDALAGEIPERNRALAEAFTAEWKDATERFALMLSKRAAIEKVLGQKLTLPNPTPTDFDLGEVAKPDQLLIALNQAVQSAGAVAVETGPDPRGILKPFVPGALYVMDRDFQDSTGPTLQASTLVIEASLEPGWLAHLVRIGDAIPATDSVRSAAVAAAHSARINQQAAATEAARNAVSPFLNIH